MFLNKLKSTYLFLVLLMISCAKQVKKTETKPVEPKKEVITLKTGAERTDLYLSKLRGKNVGIVANQTSVLENQESRIKNQDDKLFVHLVDTLLALGVNVKKVYAPEHGFRGKADAAELVKDGVDTKTQLPLISLYGKSKKPSAEQLKGIDVVLFDIQDVGARFYTYISTLHYVMEACAEQNIPVIVLDRPNPNCHYIDGPILELEHKSFVGMHKVPVVYGMTIGEYGKMINGEQWLKNKIKCDLTIIPLAGYTHETEYSLPIRPSPNLPNDKSINLYPSLGFFEGTTINAGRGTESQFQMYGAPFFEKTGFSYIPKANFGAKYPKHKNDTCNGIDLRKIQRLSKIDLSFLLDAYKRTPKKEKFFGKTFTIHAGSKKLQKQLEEGLSQEEIRASWQDDLKVFKQVREKYLIYK